jgi:hypothetical protein
MAFDTRSDKFLELFSNNADEIGGRRSRHPWEPETPDRPVSVVIADIWQLERFEWWERAKSFALYPF